MISTALNPIGIIFIVIGCLLLAAGLGFILYVFVFSRNAYKKQLKDLQKTYSYLDALLIGTDSQYIHRLEIISRTNLLYVEIHSKYSKYFKEVYDSDDKFVDSMLKQIKTLMDNKQYKNIKNVISDARKALATLEEKVTKLDSELMEIIKPEDDSRQSILKLKDDYRHIKQTFYANSNDLNLVSSSFIRVFDKLDGLFTSFETYIEGAEYDEAQALIPEIDRVIKALSKALSILPNYCILVNTVIPEKIATLKEEYLEVERKGVPLFNLSFYHRVDNWNQSLEEMKKKLVSLDTNAVSEKLTAIQKEIESVHTALSEEIGNKEYFEGNMTKMYQDVIELQKEFFKLVALVPEAKKIYIVDQEHLDAFDSLKESMNKLDSARRTLDGFIHASTEQPFSTLKAKLVELNDGYLESLKLANAFKAYIDSLKSDSQKAYSLIFDYYFRLKEAESNLRIINVQCLTDSFSNSFKDCYNLLNEIDKVIKVMPIDVKLINEMVTQLESSADYMLMEITNKTKEQQLAESAIVYANRDRNRQSNVHQQLSVLESSFFKGDFADVYHQATDIYTKSHAEVNDEN